MSNTNPQQDAAKVRLDKWLWAARFYKTRAIAKAMIEGGKVHYDGQRAKCSKLVEVGARLQIRQGNEEKTIEVVALSDQRRGAPEAQKPLPGDGGEPARPGAARRRAQTAGQWSRSAAKQEKPPRTVAGQGPVLIRISGRKVAAGPAVEGAGSGGTGAPPP